MNRHALAAMLVMSLMAVAYPAPTLAAPSCDGHPATIVGTRGADEIVGTLHDDVIVARGGDDYINGSWGADLVCGGPGDDRIRGDKGDDRLLGNGGEDVITGARGDDRLEGGFARDYLAGDADDDRLLGGPGHDACLQGSGRGRLTGCENAYADLAILALDCPDAATLETPFECQVTFTNHGPETAHAVLVSQPPPRCDTGSCGIFQMNQWTVHTVDHPDAGALLAPGDERTDTIEVTITKWGSDNAIKIRVRPIDVFDAIDPEASNTDARTQMERA